MLRESDPPASPKRPKLGRQFSSVSEQYVHALMASAITYLKMALYTSVADPERARIVSKALKAQSAALRVFANPLLVQSASMSIGDELLQMNELLVKVVTETDQRFSRELEERGERGHQARLQYEALIESSHEAII